MIESVEVIKWSDELKVRGWYVALQDKIASGEFRLARSSFVNGVSKEVDAAFRELEKVASQSDRNLANMLAYLNFRHGKIGRLEMPYDGTDRHWLRINGRVMNIEVADEYEGRGMIRKGLDVVYVDKEGDDVFWIAIANELTKACRCELPEMHEEFAEEWANWCP